MIDFIGKKLGNKRIIMRHLLVISLVLLLMSCGQKTETMQKVDNSVRNYCLAVKKTIDTSAKHVRAYRFNIEKESVQKSFDAHKPLCGFNDQDQIDFLYLTMDSLKRRKDSAYQADLKAVAHSHIDHCDAGFRMPYTDSLFYDVFAYAMNHDCHDFIKGQSELIVNNSVQIFLEKIPVEDSLDYKKIKQCKEAKSKYIEFDYLCNRITKDSLLRSLKSSSVKDYGRLGWMVIVLDKEISDYILNEILCNDSAYSWGSIYSWSDIYPKGARFRSLLGNYMYKYHALDELNSFGTIGNASEAFYKLESDTLILGNYQKCKDSLKDSLLNKITIDVCKYIANVDVERLKENIRKRKANRGLSYPPKKDSVAH